MKSSTPPRNGRTADLRVHRRIPRWTLPLQPPSRYKGASGGRGSGKSHFFAEEAVEDMVCDPSLRFVCIREVQRSLKFSAKSLVENKIQSLGVADCFDVYETEIRRRGGTGLMIFEGMQDHTAESIKSLEGFGRAWVEEAQSISQRSLDLLLPTIRMPGSEIWFSWNPAHPSDAVDQFFTTTTRADGATRVHVTYRDNPFCPDVLLHEAARLQTADPDAYEHIWGGGYFLGGHGRVYSSFKNRPYPDGNIDESIEDTNGDLLVGMDFNVNPMSAVVGVRVVDELLILDALEIPTSNTDEMAAEIRRRYPNRRIIVCPDPSGRQRKTSAPVGQTDFTILERHKFTVRAPLAAPAVVDRINNAQAMYFALDTGRRRIRIHPRAKPLVTALSNLTYKEGTSAPDKRSGFDHLCFAGDTLVETPSGLVRMVDLPPEGMVMGPLGEFVEYVGASRTAKRAATVRVEFASGDSVVCTPDHRFLTTLGWLRAIDLMQTTRYVEVCDIESLATRFRNLMACSTISVDDISRERDLGYTASSMPRSTGQFRKDAPLTSITSTAIGRTTIREIWSWSPRRLISRGTCENPLARRDRRNRYACSLVTPRGNGTRATKGAPGIASITSERPPRFTSSTMPSVNSAARSTRASESTARHSALDDACLLIGGRSSSTSRHALACVARLHSDATNISKPATVQGAALHSRGRVVSVQPGDNADVYDLCVPGVGAFALASGFVVSNCDAADYLLWQEFNVLTQPWSQAPVTW